MKKTLTFIITAVLILSGACSPVTSGYSCAVSEHWPVNALPLWSRPGIAIYSDPFNPLMQGTASKVFVVTGQDFEYGTGKILAFDTQSGNVLWQKSMDSPGGIITSNSHLYSALNDEIEVVDPQTGNLIKEIQIPGVGPIYNLSITDHNLYASTKSGRWLTYNIDDGTSSLSEPFLPYHPFLIENGVMYLYESRTFKAKDIETQSFLWEYPINEDFDQIFTDNVIIILGQRSVYGLDKKTGDLLWNVNVQIVSNIATNKSQLYFLTNDGYLKMLDLNSGQEITKLEFTPASFEPNSPPSGNIIGAYDLWVDSENDIIVLSFGDSCQLMALKLQMP